MSNAILELIIRLKDEASAQAEKLKGNLGGLKDALGGFATLAGGAALAGVTALGVGIAGGVEDARQAQMLYAATEQTIASMGNAAGVSAQHVVDMASALSDASGKSLFGDDQIQQSTNLLLTFGEIKGATLDAATALSVDLAQALGGAPKDQAMMLGKALNDPINGMTALGKAGLTFSEEQKAAITAMQESGDIAGAQAIIIAELNKQVGGQAEAAAIAAGGMVRFQAGLGETFETIGSRLLPVLDQLGAWLGSPEVQAAIETFATNLANGITIAADFTTNKLIPAMIQLYNFLAPVLIPIFEWLVKALGTDFPNSIQTSVDNFERMKTALGNFKENYIDPIGRGFDYVVASAANAKQMFDDFIAGVQGAVIPDWLQGHSPPPMADWFSFIADAANDATAAIPAFNGGGGPLPPIPVGSIGGGRASGASSTHIQFNGPITVNIPATLLDPRDQALRLRDELIRIGNENGGSSGVI